jgi:hypothetical protein
MTNKLVFKCGTQPLFVDKILIRRTHDRTQVPVQPMTAVEKAISAKSKNSHVPAKVRFQESISCLRLVWRRKITNQSAF